MEFEDRAYSVLEVSASEKFNGVFAQILSGSRFASVKIAAGCQQAKRLLDAREFDLIIINAPLPDEFGDRFAADAAARTQAAVLLMTRPELYDELLAKMAPQGVFMLSKQTSSAMIRQALDWMITAREMKRGAEKKTLKLSDKMDEIRLVNRAKLLLIEKEAMSEEEAHHWIERSAMNRCVTRRVIADEIIEKYNKQQ